MGTLAIARLDAVPAVELARSSRAWSAGAFDARLVVGTPSDDAVVLGSFQRSSDAAPVAPLPSLLRRGSGGALAVVGAGTVWVQLSLSRSDALIADCTPDKLLNRYVRPLLRALTRVTSVPASYFGRDWISAAHRPVALVAFAHEASTGSCLFEAIVAARTGFAAGARPSFLGKEPATLEEVARRPIETGVVAEAIVDAYRGIATEAREEAAPLAPPGANVEVDPPWTASLDEAIGTVAAGRDATGRLRVGGELMASGDAVARLEELVATLPEGASRDELGRAVDEALTTRGAITFGVRSLASIRDVIAAALAD